MRLCVHHIKPCGTWLLLVLCLLTSGISGAATPSKTATAAMAGLTAAQAKRMAALGAPGPIPVAVPTYVPEGYRLVGIDVSGSDAMEAYVEYSIRYESPNGNCFAIQSKTAERIRFYRAALLRTGAPIFAGKGDRDGRIFRTQPDVEPIAPGSVFSGWLGAGPRYYRLASGPMVAPGCVSIGSATAVEIVESLRWLEATAPRATGADPFDFAAYKAIPAESITIPMRKEYASPERRAVTYVLNTLGLAGANAKPASLEAKLGADMTVWMLATYDDLPGDSVAAKRYLMKMSVYGREWFMGRIGAQYRCQPGHGHRNWSKQPCR